jgi:AraC-like DNA-binding protein
VQPLRTLAGRPLPAVRADESGKLYPGAALASRLRDADLVGVPHLRIIDIAVECCFSSDATFIRAFRRQFGITPGEVRELADRKDFGAPPGKIAPLAEPDAESARWLKELTGAMPLSAARD